MIGVRSLGLGLYRGCVNFLVNTRWLCLRDSGFRLLLFRDNFIVHSMELMEIVQLMKVGQLDTETEHVQQRYNSFMKVRQPRVSAEGAHRRSTQPNK